MRGNFFHPGDSGRTGRRVLLAALVVAVLSAIYGASSLWGAAAATIGSVLLLAVCVGAVARSVRQLGDRSTALDDRTASLAATAEAAAAARPLLADDVGALRGDVTALRGDVTALRGDVTVVRGDVGALRGEQYIGFSRRLDQETEAELCSVWSERLGVTLEPPYLRYLERKLLQIEAAVAGRLASHMYDGLLRAVVARSVTGREFNGLEIGVLFGISAMVILEAVGPFFERAHMTLIDPFEGYYAPDELDPMTRLPVSRRLLQRNLDRLGVPPEQYTVIQGYSADDAVGRQVSGRTFNFVLIDGDHSFEGVTADFERYAPMIQPRGYLVLDDYGAPEWPGVTRFVEEVLSASPLFECVGTASRTAVFRRI